ncbi:MAG: ATP synthase F1 subunit gamma [Bacteroidales bacterium]|jgi:F-type H+-transporting ATPase subunit gamma|nr:ATP synthase F1 subunit gamma [Bacteroidales bacterium]MCB9029128.1 ATP synthase F1 subunit gamma [Bacteroidales bacterium]HNT94003.1 ATP synthase F1 subunit gamma [Bacteroidales bacterium]HOO66178.1 ATP synthase F1 subunit gamma [Bacteroidales bacterium]HPE22613.1 ATP synthase F1 subunit gamma [Bacteroidales bacterium]
MANLKAIRVRLSSVKSTRQITSAMKMVAAAKLRKAQDSIVQLRPYADKLNEIRAGLSAALRDTEIENIYAERKKGTGRVLLVVITSNKGLCGAFNANVIRETRHIMAEKYGEQMRRGDLALMTVGKKAADTFKKLKFNIMADHSDLYTALTFDRVAAVADRLMELYLSREYDTIELIYNQFKNAAVQKLTRETYLPVTMETDAGEKSAPADYIYEPDQVSIISELIPKTLRIQLYKAVLDSFAAEQGARMTAMHQATDNATELIRDLTLQYNKARQAAITNQLLEVVSGAEALNG